MYVYRDKIKIPAGKVLKIVPIGDVQGEEELPRLEALVRWCVAQEKQGHIVRLFGCGDYMETFSPSERVKLAGANFHETSLEDIDNGVKFKADHFVKLMDPMKGRIMLLLRGHHWKDIRVGRRILSTDEYIAEKLGAEYAGDGFAVMDLLINGIPFRIVAMHGYGSARTPGAKLTKRIRMREVFLNANWYASGHDNQKIVDAEEPLILEGGDVRYLKQYFSGIGSFQIAYNLNKLETGYAERLALPPASVGVVVCSIEAKEKKLDYHVSA